MGPVLAFDALTALGAVATSLATLAGGWAVLQARRTEKRSADRQETQQALDAQSSLLDRYEKRITHLEARNSDLHGRINDVLAKFAVVSEGEKACKQRLAIAEARISELGG